MRVFTTLTDQRIELDFLSDREQHLAGRCWELLEKHQNAKTTTSRDRRALSYAKEVNEELLREGCDQRRTMRGPLGTLLTDCYLRLYWNEEWSDEQKAAFRDSVQHNPGRLLVQKWLESGKSKQDFATAAGLKNEQISRLFKFVLEPWEETSPGVSVDLLFRAFQKLGVVPAWSEVSAEDNEPSSTEPACTEPVYNEPGGQIPRDRHLWIVIAAITRVLCAEETCRPDVLTGVRRLLGLHLGALYGIDDVGVLNDTVDEVLRDVLTVPRLQAAQPATEDTAADGEKTTGLPTEGELVALEPGLCPKTNAVLLVPDEQLQELLEPYLRHGPQFAGTADDSGQECGTAGPWADACRENWGKALSISRDWLTSWMYEESQAVTQRRLHPTQDRVRWERAEAEGGWNAEDSAHIASCRLCQQFCRQQTALPLPLAPRVRFRILPRGAHTNGRRRSERAAPAGDREVIERQERLFPLDLDQRISHNAAWRVSLTLNQTALAVTLRTDQPVLVRCSIAGRSAETEPLTRFLLANEAVDGSYTGTCRFPRDELHGLMLRDQPRTGDEPLEFSYPSVLVINPNALSEQLSDEDRESILNEITRGDCDDATLQRWRDWVQKVRPVVRPNTERWLNTVETRLEWHVLRAVYRLLYQQRAELLDRLDQRIDGLLAALIGRYPGAQHGWIFKKQQEARNGPDVYKALWSKNTESKDWVLLGSYPSVVRSVARTGQGCYCGNSQTHGDYWNYDSSATARSALAQPLAFMSADRPSSHRAALQDRLGVVILEAETPDAFNAAQLTDLGVAAYDLMPQLLARKSLANRDRFCPWHPGLDEFNGDRNCWHLIDLLEQVCHAIMRAVNKYGSICSVWYLDWGTGKASILASTGYMQWLKTSTLDLPASGGVFRATVDWCAAHPGQAYRPTDFAEEFTLQSRRGLKYPVLMPIALPEGNGKPPFVLVLCKSEYAPQGELPADDELTELVRLLGNLLEDFTKLRGQIVNVRLQQHLANVGPDFRGEIIPKIRDLLIDIFQTDDCAIWVKNPSSGFERVVPPPDTRVEDLRDDVDRLCDRLDRTKQPFSKKVRQTPEFDNLYRSLGDSKEALNKQEKRKQDEFEALREELRKHKKAVRFYGDEPLAQWLSTGHAAPDRVLACAVATEEAGGPDLVFILKRKAGERPYTQFYEELLQQLAQWCGGAYRDWRRELKAAGGHDDRPRWDRLLPTVNSIPALARDTLTGLVQSLRQDQGLETVVGRLIFPWGRAEAAPQYYRYAEEPCPVVQSTGERVVWKEPQELTGLLQQVLQTRRPAVYDTIAGGAARSHACIPFFSWVGSHLARGVLVLDFSEPVHWASTSANDDHTVNLATLLAAGRRLTAIFSKQNYESDDAHLDLNCYKHRTEPTHEEERAWDNYLKRVVEYLRPFKSLKCPGTIVEGVEPASSGFATGETLGAWSVRQHQQTDRKDLELTLACVRDAYADLDLYGVRATDGIGSLRLRIPLYVNTEAIGILCVSLPSGWHLPLRKGEDLQDYKNHLGKFARELCELVGEVTGYWESLTLWLEPTEITIQNGAVDEAGAGERWVRLTFPRLPSRMRAATTTTTTPTGGGCTR